MSDNSNTRHKIVTPSGVGTQFTAGSACAPVGTAHPAYPRIYSRNAWAVPRISMDAVVRVILGHRPYRPPGFRVEREEFDGKVVVHNYGHGGGGLSLGWGSSALAVLETSALSPGEVAVIGSGIMGLCSARLLQDAGWDVTIYTRDTYQHTTSNVAGGEWGPFSVHDPNVADDGFKRKLDWAARRSHHTYANLAGPKYGIRWAEVYELADTPGSEETVASYDDLFAYKRVLAEGEHPFPSRYARARVTMKFDPATLLRQLTEDFRVAGGKLQIRTFESISDVLSLPNSVIFNCTGLGAAELFGDGLLIPAKGQLVFLPPDPAVDYLTADRRQGLMYMLPRSDAVVLGGICRAGDGSHHVEDEETERIVTEHQAQFAAFG